jgi:hypothetical protein
MGLLGGTWYGTYAPNWTYERDQKGTFLDRRGRRSSKGVNYDILAQGLIGLIEYSYHQGIPSFWEAQLKRTSGLSVFGPEQFQEG